MDQVEYDKVPHRRFNLLTGEWVLVSPHRTQRPWTGQEEPPDTTIVPKYDADCYLCPGNSRAGGEKNPDYRTTFVFTNDFAALIPEQSAQPRSADNELLRLEPEQGLCRVICYSPRHDLALSRMPKPAVISLIDTWINEYHELGCRQDINHVQIFENRGIQMGCSNLHPHGQIWANSTIPTIPSREAFEQKEYFKKTGACLICHYLAQELEIKTRILFVNDSFVALVPFWAVWPYETMIIPRFHSASISPMSGREKSDLALIMIELGICYDNLFLTSFPYSMGIHQEPTDGHEHTEWHWHLHYLPPLLRSQSVKKHMVGYELLAMPQRDITAEAAAERLRTLPKQHYLYGRKEK